MTRASVVMDIGGMLMEADLDRIIDKLIGEKREPTGEVPLVEEYRLVEQRGDGLIQGHPLGVVNESFALRKADEMRAEPIVRSVIVQRRAVLRGSWEPHDPTPSQG